ncbi:hypothetical protein BDM02DRAFT_3124044, partial [Thelephora ganbajun]
MAYLSTYESAFHSTGLYVSPIALNSTAFPKVTVVLDLAIALSEAVFAIHAGSSSDTVLTSGKDLVSVIRDCRREGRGFLCLVHRCL